MLACLFSVSAIADEAGPFEVGSKRFTESYILGEIATERVTQVEPSVHRVGLGNTAVTLAALQSGAIECYPEYIGTIEFEVLHRQHPSGDLDEVNRALAQIGLIATAPLGFADRYALAVSEATASRLHLARLSDLAQHPELRFGLSQEFLGRADGWPGLARRYDLPQQPQGLDHGLAYRSLESQQIDVIDVYSTDAHILADHLVVLDDDRHFFPNYAAVMLARGDVRARDPRAWQALQSLAGTISQERMISMNSAVELSGRDFRDVAHEFLSGKAIAPTQGTKHTSWLAKLFAPDLLRLTLEHLRLVLLSVTAGMLVGIPLGVLARRTRWLRTPVLAITGVLQTIPSLALLAFLIPIVGRIGTWPALIALFLYSLLPIVRNTLTGLEGIPAGLVEAASALGLNTMQRLWLIELPIASAVIVAGIKTATILAIGTATLAALIGAGGLGERITIGLALNDDGMLLAGAIPAAALALFAEAIFAGIEHMSVRRRALRGTMA